MLSILQLFEQNLSNSKEYRQTQDVLPFALRSESCEAIVTSLLSEGEKSAIFCPKALPHHKMSQLSEYVMMWNIT